MWEALVCLNVGWGGVQGCSWQGQRGTATGFFHTQQIDGVWWLVDPEGELFLSKGVNHVSYTADHAPALGYSPYGRVTAEKYGSAEAWAQAAVARLRSWGFNTIGAWSSPETFRQGMAYTLILDIGATAGGEWQRGTFPDVFSEGFRQAARRVAEEKCAPRREDPLLLGYFTDNELRWGPDWRSDQGLLADFWEFPAESPGKQEAVRFLREHYPTIEAFNRAWGTSFASFEALQQVPHLKAVGETLRQAQWAVLQHRVLGNFPREAILWYLRHWYETIEKFNARWETDFHSFEEVLQEQPFTPQAQELANLEAGFLRRVAAQYFKVCAEAIREWDPHHLILGCRYAGYAPDEVVQSMGDHVDVVSYNNYDFRPPVEKLRQIHEWTGKPVMLTEFSFKAMDSGLPNTRGAGQPVQTQAERADCFEAYVTALLQLPFAVGFHWFEYADEPAEGRFDGENSNYGLVNIRDEPWEILTTRMREVNARLEKIHASPGP